jgi:hypothetical protein
MVCNRWKYITLSAVAAAVIIFPSALQGQMLDFVGRIRTGFGYYDNNYLKEQRDKEKSYLSSQDFQVEDYDQIYDSTLVIGIFIDLTLYYKNFGFGISSGVIDFLNYLSIAYDGVNVDEDYAVLKLNAYLLPQNLNVYYNVPIIEKLSFRIGGGPGYYCTLITKRTEVRGPTASDTKDFYYVVHDKNLVKHDFGIQALAELSYRFSKNFSFDFGFNCHFMFGVSPLQISYQGYIGITEIVSY